MKVMSLENLAWFGTWDKFASILSVNKNYEIVQILSLPSIGGSSKDSECLNDSLLGKRGICDSFDIL
jgi:hypothetical protein